MLEASLLMDNAKHFRHRFGGTLVTTILAVALAAGGDFSAFFVFLPQFLFGAWLVLMVAVLVCFGSRRDPRQQDKEEAEEGLPKEEEKGINTGIYDCLLL